MSHPKDIEDKLERVVNGWRTLAPEKTFSGLTLSQFQAACAGTTITRELIAELQDKLTQAMANRDVADERTAAMIQRVVNGVLADQSEGPDSALYEAFGYTRKSARKTGLTRKRKEAPAT